MAGILPAAALEGEVTSLAICWRVVRRDGVALGFTTHDRSLVIGGMRYESAPGMTPSAVVSSDGLDIDTMDVGGALSADAITGADLAAGRFDGAQVTLFIADWTAPESGSQVLAQGSLGTVESGVGSDAGFTATLRGPTAALTATRIETYSPGCRAELGDWRCRVAMRGRVFRTVAAYSDGERLRLDGVDPARAGDMIEGSVRIVAGNLAGVERRIVATDGELLVLDEPLAAAAGTAVEVREGCDKRFVTCVERFANGENFRGEPHVPGGDMLTRVAGF